MLLLLDELVHLSCVDAIAFLSVTRDAHVVRNVLFSHQVGYRILFFGKIPTQKRCSLDCPDQSPTLPTGAEGLKQEQPLAFHLAAVTVGLWSNCCWSSASSCRKVPSGVLLCPPAWWGGGRGASSFLSDFVFPHRHSSFFFPPSSSFLSPLLVLTVPALHSWQSLSTVIRTEDVCALGCFPPLQPADPFTRTWNHGLDWPSRW